MPEIARPFKLTADSLGWVQSAVNQTGQIIAQREFLLPLDGARKAALDTLSFAHREEGADVNQTLRRELDANEERVQTVLRDLRKSQSRDEIDKISRWLNLLVEFSQYLQKAYVSPHDFDEGVIHIVRNDLGPGRNPVYLVMFARYLGPGGALKPLTFHGEDTLQNFLTVDLHIDPMAIGKAFEQLANKGTAGIHNVRLSRTEQQWLGL